MKAPSSTLQQPDVLRVFQSKGEPKAFYNKISHAHDLDSVSILMMFLS